MSKQSHPLGHTSTPDAQLIEVTNYEDKQRHFINVETGEETTEPYQFPEE